MADIVNRIVPSSVALDRASWQGRERKRKGEKSSLAESVPSEEPATAQATDGAESAPKDPKTDKGKHLDVSV
jgi:hypothetical protein